MAEQRMKAREKTVQKMTKDGLVEENLADKSTVRVSSRTRDVQMSKRIPEKGWTFPTGGGRKRTVRIRSGILCRIPEMHRQRHRQ